MDKLDSAVKKTVFCLIRHGATDYNIENRLQGWIDTSLNDEGKMQATELAVSIKKNNTGM